MSEWIMKLQEALVCSQERLARLHAIEEWVARIERERECASKNKKKKDMEDAEVGEVIGGFLALVLLLMIFYWTLSWLSGT